jgi:predicted GTPase
MKKRVLILGAAGRDFHNFNMVFRDNDEFEVVAFTATQIPKIEGRVYPAKLAGKLYPNGIPILREDDMEQIIKDQKVDQVVFAYSDVTHQHVMHLASRALSCGADYLLLGDNKTMLRSSKPVIAVTATRTGCGKSQTSRAIVEALKKAGVKTAALRHPMPYGDLAAQAVQRFATLEDLVKHKCTIEEMEEYEPYIANGMLIFAGVDYAAILREAEKEADVILWDGGNNDTPFVRPDLDVVVADPLRPEHGLAYHPGEANLRRATVVVCNKVDSATKEQMAIFMATLKEANPKAQLILADSEVTVDKPELVKGKRCLVIEDGPTTTHGGMTYGAGYVAAKKLGAASIVDPRPYAVGSIADAFKKYTHVTEVLPALGYFPEQLADLKESIDRADCDLVVVGTPIDLRRFIPFSKPSVRVYYNLAQHKGGTNLEEMVLALLKSRR